MARLYADEQFPRIVVELLRQLGHDILTVQEAGKDNKGIPDEEVLEFAIAGNRAVLAENIIVIQHLKPSFPISLLTDYYRLRPIPICNQLGQGICVNS